MPADRPPDVEFGDGREPEADVIAAVDADIDLERESDGVYYVRLATGGYIAFGEDDGWWTATEYAPDAEAADHTTIYTGGDLGELGAIIRQRVAWAAAHADEAEAGDAWLARQYEDGVARVRRTLDADAGLRAALRHLGD